MTKIAIVSDFSKTLTDSSNPTTWSVFAKSWLLWEEYTKERDIFFDIYHKFELEWNIEKTKEWWKEHLNLFIKFWLTLELIRKIIRDEKYFKPRKGLEIFFDTIFKKNIEIMIITSSWISNFVNEFLNYKWVISNNIELIWNTLKVDDRWKVVWYKDDIITSLNKWQYSSNLWHYEKVVLLWDDESDLDMYNWNNVIKIWFCSEEKIKWYDIYLWKNWNLEEVLEYIN